jgi:hypothetical protein
MAPERDEQEEVTCTCTPLQASRRRALSVRRVRCAVETLVRKVFQQLALTMQIALQPTAHSFNILIVRCVRHQVE